mgnify:CR=1 FL=1
MNDCTNDYYIYLGTFVCYRWMIRSDEKMRCPKCDSNVYSHHQKINKSGTEIRRNYACRKCKYVFETIEQVIEADKEESK